VTASGGATASGGTGGATNSGGAGAGGAGSGGAGGADANGGGAIRVLIWNNALAYGHAARVNAIPYLQAREATDNITFDTTYAHTGTATDGPSDTSFDASVFTDDGLDRYDVVMFLDTTGNTIDDSQKTIRRQALQDFITKKGRGFVGTHSATDTYQAGVWPWYVDFIGANYHDHSNTGTSGTAKYFQAGGHPILTAAATPNPWNRAEEWYTFTRDPLSSTIPGIKIILTCHDQTIPTERPTAWVHEMPLASGAPRGGRLFYTAMGHATSAFKEKAFMDLLINGIKWAAHRLE
jgi:type 1 glutamine amidotransferase